MDSSAAWHGARIILGQVSPESPGIFDFIMELYALCSGDWGSLTGQDGITSKELSAFLEYAATFLSNIGNYYVRLLSSTLVACPMGPSPNMLVFYRVLGIRSLSQTLVQIPCRS